MVQKNNNLKRKFIPQSIGDTIKKINRHFVSKFGKIEFIIQSKWPEIAGSYFAEYSEPKNITRLPDYENEIGEIIHKNYLNISVAPAAAIEFQHFKDTILEKINSYFGYRAIKDLRIQQNYLPNEIEYKKKEVSLKKISELQKKLIFEEVEKTKNNDLKESLIKLGINIERETDK